MRTHAARDGGVRLTILIVVALACGALTVFHQSLAVLGSDFYPDTDDALRMVQVRNLINGQSWFDLTEARLDPPFGVVSHWSRLIDAPLVVLIKAFSLFLAPDMAERTTRVAWPLALTGVLYLAVVRLTGAVLGANRAPHALLAIFLTTPFQIQFQPGRIDHHAAQMILLTLTVWGAIASLARPRLAAASAAAFALSLAISLENLPFAPVVALPAVAWIVHGGRADRARLLWFAGAAAIFTPAAFAATVAPSRWALPFNDALSGAHILAVLAGALVYVALAASTARLHGRRPRLVAALAVGGVAAAILAALFPWLLRSPYADVDPLVRALWLDHVMEVQPIQVLMRGAPLQAFAATVPLLLGLAGALAAARRSEGLARLGWLTLAAPLAVGVACLFWMTRAAFSATPLAIPGLVYLGLRVQTWAAGRTRHAGEAAGFAFFILFTSTPQISALGAFLAPEDSGKTVASHASAQDCHSAAALRPLDALPQGLVFGDIDLGPYLLAYTHHAAVAGPQHRNSHGDRLVLRAMQAGPAAARALVGESRADYVALCRSQMRSWATDADRLPEVLAGDGDAGRQDARVLRRLRFASDAIVVFKVETAGPQVDIAKP